MFNFFKKQKNVQFKPVTEILDRLSAQGISQERLCGEHLHEVYRGLRRYEGAPDFSKLELILNDSPESSQAKATTALAVMVETREHPLLVPVIKNLIEVTDLDVQIFHGTGNKEFIEQSALRPLIESGKITLSALQVSALSATEYNTLLLSKRFWRQLRSRGKVLIFQTDSILCKRSEFTLKDFEQFDYIGAKWKRERPVGLLLEGGNGGLSLRDWTQSYECLRRFPPERWPSGEDGYFAFHLALMGANVGKSADCARFATQDWFLEKSFGAHQVRRLSESDKQAFLEYCPEAAIIL